MKIFKFVPAILTLCIVLGIIFGFYIEPTLLHIIISLLVLLSFLLISYFISNKSFSKNIHFNIISYVLFFVIGIATVSFQNQKNRKNHYSHFIDLKNTSVLTIKKRLKSTTYYDKYEVKVSQINQNKTIGNILLNIQKDSLLTSLNIDDKVIVSESYNLINEPKNLYQFNYRKYLEKQQIHHQVTCKNTELIRLKSKKITINGVAAFFRKKINDALKKYHFKNDELAIINALLLGQRQNISKELMMSYQSAGAVHILAVSGLHVGVLFLLFSFLSKPVEKFKNGKIIKLIMVISFLWLFAIIAGLSASVVRAVTMFTAIAIGQLSNRKSSTLNNLFISMFILLLINPLFLFSVGFQLSYLAVFSIVYLYPKFIIFYKPKNIILKYFWQLFAISCAAQIGILPLSLYYFHQFPSLFFVSSLIIIPFLGTILGLGILVVLLAILNILPQFIADFYSNIISLMNKFIGFIANQEAFLFTKISFSALLLISFYLLIILSFRFIDKKTISRFSLVLIGIVLIQIVLIFEKQQLQYKNEFIIFNKNKSTLIAQRNGENLTIFKDTTLISKSKILENYIIGSGKLQVNINNSINNIYTINNQKLLLIDSLGVYKINSINPEMVLLTQSPKINLNRLINKIKPKIIIADASNYKSYTNLWKRTCKNNNVIFYSTYQKGAFRLVH